MTLSWWHGLQLLAMVTVGVGLLYGYFGHGTAQRDTRGNLSQIPTILVLPNLWMMVVLFSLAICSALGIYAMLPLHLVTEYGISEKI